MMKPIVAAVIVATGAVVCGLLDGCAVRRAEPTKNRRREITNDKISPLEQAVNEGNAALVNKLLGEGISGDQRTQEGDSLLVAAITRGAPFRGISSKAGSGMKGFASPLFGGYTESRSQSIDPRVPANNKDIVKALVDAGADVNTRSRDGTTCLMLAAITGQPSVLQVLIDAGVDSRGIDASAALVYAARTAMARLISGGEVVTGFGTFTAGPSLGSAIVPVSDGKQLIPLPEKVRLLYLKVVEVLMRAGTNPNSMRLKGYELPQSRMINPDMVQLSTGTSGEIVGTAEGDLGVLEVARLLNDKELVEILQPLEKSSSE